MVFLAVAFGMAYWLTKSDDFDLITFLRSAIESTLNQSVDSPSQSPPAPVARPLTMPATAGPSTPPVSPAGASRETRAPVDLEGLSQDEVRQRLGPPMRTITGGDGVTVWVYRNGALLVYFYKDRSSLKPPRT